MSTVYENFKAKMTASGVNWETACSIYNALRDSQEHDWSEQAIEWCGDTSKLLKRALEDPARIAAVCDYFVACDGGLHLEGLRHLDERKMVLAETTIFGGWDVKIDPEELPAATTWEPKSETEIQELIDRSIRKKFGDDCTINKGQLARVQLDTCTRNFIRLYLILPKNTTAQCLVETEEWEGSRGVEIRIGVIEPGSSDVVSM